jgi:hypothetical protein
VVVVQQVGAGNVTSSTYAGEHVARPADIAVVGV